MNRYFDALGLRTFPWGCLHPVRNTRTGKRFGIYTPVCAVGERDSQLQGSMSNNRYTNTVGYSDTLNED